MHTRFNELQRFALSLSAMVIMAVAGCPASAHAGLEEEVPSSHARSGDDPDSEVEGCFRESFEKDIESSKLDIDPRDR